MSNHIHEIKDPSLKSTSEETPSHSPQQPLLQALSQTPTLTPTPTTTPSNHSANLTMKLPKNLTFGPFPITSTQAFHISPTNLTYALVNLRPLLPGHTLICPVRRVPRLSQLSDSETTDLFLTVKRVSRMLERVYGADALNVAVQDGVEAGQSVNHVHVHVIPRRKGDSEEGKGDEIYERMDGGEGNLGRVWVEFLEGQRVREGREKRGEREFGGEEGKRVDRSEEEMGREAEMLRGEMEKERVMEGSDGGGVDGVSMGSSTG